MNKAAVSGAIPRIKDLEAASQNNINEDSYREQCRREARRLRSLFGLMGVTLQ
jgi:hypothetical protein